MLFIVVIFVRWEFFTHNGQQINHQSQPQTRQVTNWQQLKLTGQRAGSKDAPVQIVEFFDYQCPFCKRAQPVVKTIRQKYPKKVAVTHENFPLSSHPYAFGAAIAAECVRKQSPALFMAYHDSLFANQNLLGRLSYAKLAASTGIADTAAFHQCLEDQATSGTVKSGQSLAGRLDIHAIPTFLINGTLVTGVLSRQQLDGLVQDALAKAAEDKKL